MHLLSAEPRPNQVMSGSGVAFALHFDHPLDHQASRFMLSDAGGARRTVPVRLGAQPPSGRSRLQSSTRRCQVGGLGWLMASCRA